MLCASFGASHGVATLEGTGSFTRAGLGDLLVLAGVLSAAAYTIVARGMGDESDPLTVTACQFTTATILILPAVTFVWAMHVETAPSHVAARFWFAALFVGVIGYAASFLLYNYAIARVRAAPASIIVNLIPVFGLASAVFWPGDSLTAARVLGAILIGLSVTIFTAAELAEARSAAKRTSRPRKPDRAVVPAAAVAEDRTTPPTLEEFRTQLRAYAGTDFGVRSARWLSRFTDATRLAERYRAGRVFLARRGSDGTPRTGCPAPSPGPEPGWPDGLMAQDQDLGILSVVRAGKQGEPAEYAEHR